MKLLIGADPEIWIKNNATGKIISADGLFPGTKEAPHRVMHGAVQVDGMAAEYNILPASSKGEFIFNNISVLRSLRDIIKEHNPDLDFSFEFSPVAHFGEEYIANQREEARRLGCTPDFNAYDGGNPNPTPDAEMPYRTASGHIHLGWTEDQDITDPDHIEACCMMAKQLDAAVGVHVFELEGKDGHVRRNLYGKAGAFRPKSYGVEYRTPSNSWLSSTFYMGQMFSTTLAAFNSLVGGERYYEYDVYRPVQTYINENLVGDKGYNIGGSWKSMKDYSHKNSGVSMDNLDKLFLDLCYCDTTNLVTKKMISEIRASLNKDKVVEPKSKKRASSPYIIADWSAGEVDLNDVEKFAMAMLQAQ